MAELKEAAERESGILTEIDSYDCIILVPR